MATPEKRLKRLRTSPQNWTISDLEQVMLDYGIERLPHGKGGHRNYGYALNGRIFTYTIPVHSNKVKQHYVKEVRKIIEEIIANG